MTSVGSVVAIEYDGGVLLGADTLISYSSMAKVGNAPRTRIISRHAAVAATGDYADFQHATNDLQGEVIDDELHADGIAKSPEELFSLLHRIVYHKRSDQEPYLCSFVVIGHDGNKSFIGATNSIGTKWSDKAVATGYGADIALPLLRKALDVSGGTLSRDQAMSVLYDCLRVTFYREARSMNRFQIAEATNGKVILHPPVMMDTQWELQGFRFEPTSIIV